MTTFPTASPALPPAEHPRDTSHISPSTNPVAYPPGPVPGDKRPSVVPMPIGGRQPGERGLTAEH